MSFTVAAAFDQFYESINLSGDHRDTANSRRDHIVSLLRRDLEVLDVFSSGSIPRFTAVRGYADVDVIAALHYGRHIKDKTPTQVLQIVRDTLGEYKTGVRKNGQAVTLFYQSWPNVDIVPCARFLDAKGKVARYDIPDMNRGAWIKSKPRLHSKHIEDRSSLCGPTFRRIIKMVKWWNHKHSEYLQSFHIEVMALRSLTSSLSDLPWDVFTYFKEAASLIQSSLWHEGSNVDEYLTWSDRGEARSRLEAARDLARDAWHATYGNNDDHKTAISTWRRIFGDRFPEYG